MLQILFEKQRKMWQTGIDKGGKMLQIYGKHIKSRRFLYEMKMLATFQFLEKCYKSNTKNKEKSGKQV